MTLAEDKVLVEIVTVANLAGIEQAKAGLLGFNPSTLALAATLGITIKVGEESIKVYENHEKAMLRLKQATEVTGQSFPAATAALADFITKNQQFIPDNNKAIDTFALLLRSTGDYKLAIAGLGDVMRLNAISPTKDWDTATQAVNLGMQGNGRGLKELGINITALKNDTDNVTDANKELTKAQAEVVKATKEHEDGTRKLAEMKANIERPGHKATTEELMRYQDQQKKVAEDTVKLQKATEDLTKAEKDVAASTDLARQVHQELDKKLGGQTPTVTDNQKAVNLLNARWQEFATKIGPNAIWTLTELTKGATLALGIVSGLYDIQAKSAALANAGLRGSGRSDTFNPPVPFSGGQSASQVAASTQNNVTVNVSGQSDPTATASEVVRQVRGLIVP